MQSEGTTFTLDLRGIAPKPERLLSVVDEIAESGHCALVVDWGESFPWSIEERLSNGALPEELVGAVGGHCRRLGLKLSTVRRAVLPAAFAGLPSYRHLYRASLDPVESEWSAGLIKLLSDLFDDMVALLPHSGLVWLTDDRAPSNEDGAARSLLEAASIAGVEVVKVCRQPPSGWLCAEDFLNPHPRCYVGMEWRLATLAREGRFANAGGEAVRERLLEFHTDLQEWHESSWLKVAEFHEILIRAMGSGCARSDLNHARSTLRRSVRTGERLAEQGEEVYAVIAPPSAFMNAASPLIDALEEQYLSLVARSAE
jgi:hypothetical protein